MRIAGLLSLVLFPVLLEGAPETKSCENGLVRTKVASHPLIKNPVSVSVDVDGTLYVTETERRKVGDLDIRQVTEWIPNDLSLTNVEEKRELFRRGITSEAFKDHRYLRDFNEDGRLDWKDLTIPTERVHRLVDTDGDGVMDLQTEFAIGFNTEVTGIAAGVLAYRGDIYATIAPDVWKLRDTTGDGVADEREVLAHGFGLHINYAGHDMHGLILGPDGRLYWTIGDKGVNVVSKEGTRWYYPHEGAVLSCFPDGSDFQVYARGLRNVQEIAFDDLGNMFGVDNDADQKGEKERFVFIAPKSDTGWRVCYQYRKEAYNPWMAENISNVTEARRPAMWLRPVCQYLDGPSGFSRNPGTGLSERYRGSFFLSQFPAGKINAFKTEVDGAGFRMVDDHVFAEDDAFIGSNFGPDGGLYVADWEGGYALNEKGVVWKIDHPDFENTPLRKEVAAYLQEGPGKIESAELLKRLEHLDQRVRVEAQWELAKRQEWGAFKEVARSSSTDAVTVAHALWGLGQGNQFDGELFAQLVKSEEAEVRAQAAKWAGDCGSLDADLAPLLADESLRVRFLAALAVADANRSDLVPAVVTLLEENGDSDEWLRHAGVTALASAARPEELGALLKSLFPAVRRAAVVAAHQKLESLFCIRLNDELPSSETIAPYVDVLATALGDLDPTIVDEAAIAIHDCQLSEEALPALARRLEAKPAAQVPATRRAIAANRRLASPESLDRLARFAARSEVPEELRLNALEILASAAVPVELDPVDGRWIDLPAAELTPETRKTLGVTLTTVSGSDALTQAAGTALDAVGERLSLEQLAARASDANLDPSLRLLALASIKNLDEGSWKDNALGMLNGPQVAIRMAVAKVLSSVEPKVVANYVKEVALSSEDLGEQQGAVALLGQLELPEAKRSLKTLLAEANAGRAQSSLLLEILEAAQAAQMDFSSLESSLKTDSRHLLEGGDEETGRKIYETKLAANCVACHRIGPVGSNVGPELTEVGKKGRAHILESLVDPQAKITEGFPSPSTMPPMGLILPPSEIRDLVEFLSTLQ